MFSCEFYEIFKNTFFTEHLRWLLLWHIPFLSDAWLQGQIFAFFNGKWVLIQIPIIKVSRRYFSEPHSEICQTSTMELFLRKKLSTIPIKSSILNVWMGSEQVTVCSLETQKLILTAKRLSQQSRNFKGMFFNARLDFWERQRNNRSYTQAPPHFT